MNDIANEFLQKAVDLHKEEKYSEAAAIYNRLLNRDPGNETLLFLMSDMYLRMEHNGLGINLLLQLVQANPSNALAWCNLGVGYRKENAYEAAMVSWKQAIKYGGETVEVCSNIASLYADRAEPQKAIEWCDKALVADKDSKEAHWQKALASLTMRDFETGWNLYEYRKQLAKWDSRETVDCPEWDGSEVGHLYIHGEQGVGDEVMFASMLPKVVGKAKNVTLEVHKKLKQIMQQTYPEWTIITDEKQANGKYDAKIALGSLSCIFKKFSYADKAQPFLKVDPARVQYYKDELAKLGKAPYIALTWVGGTKMTRVEDRSINLANLKPLMDKYTCVSAQYFDNNPLVEQERIENGLHQINEESTGLDIAEQAALFAACDYVVTVQQTAVHVAGAVGAKTFAMIGSHPHWRYGLTGYSLPWYESVRLFRKEDDWGKVVDNVINQIEKIGK